MQDTLAKSNQNLSKVASQNFSNSQQLYQTRQLAPVPQQNVQHQLESQQNAGAPPAQKKSDDLFAGWYEHKIELNELSMRLETDFTNGLKDSEAINRNKLYGDNKLSEKEKVPWWIKLFIEMTNGFSLMLWAGALLCIIAYILSPTDASNLYLGAILIFVVVLTGLITFQQQAKSEALMESFKNFLPQSTQVLRDGQIKIVPSEKLVVGDVIDVKLGDKIPADIRIINSREMKVDNSALTGESDPQLRVPECTNPNEVLETKNIAFFGTLCKEGAGRGVVIRIGDATTLGQIANLASSSETPKTPLRIELDRFVIMITVIACVLGVGFFLLAWIAINYSVLQCCIFGIGILVANVPEGLLGCITISLAITAKKLSEKQVLVKNLEAVETLGSTSCICSDKTGTLTQNKMTVENIWIDMQMKRAVSIERAEPNQRLEYDVRDPSFVQLQQCAVVSSEAQFNQSEIIQNYNEKNNANESDFNKIKFLAYESPVIGDATETALVKFFQPIEDILITRQKLRVHKQSDGSVCKMPFNSANKYALTIVEAPDSYSNYTVLIKGAPEKIWALSNQVLIRGQPQRIDRGAEDNYNQVNEIFANNGERVLGFAKLPLDKVRYPAGFKFNINSPQTFNFPIKDYIFIGLISVIDPPKPSVPFAIKKCKSAGIKVIMVTGDQPATAAAIARQVGIITEKTVDEIAKERNITYDQAFPLANAIVIHGAKITEAKEQETLLGVPEENQDVKLLSWCRKNQVVFARTTPAQKLQIVKACQKLGYIVGVTGDGVNDSPAIKQGDIGISMGISGSDVTKDAADMVLLNDDFASIVDGIEEGRKIFDNLKKTIVYLLTSNCTEIWPFIAMVVNGLPLPLSSVFMLIICVGTDILPALSLAYEDAELDIMTRRPRTREEHLVSVKLIVHAYGLQGTIATAAGFFAYFTTMYTYGFKMEGLFGLNNYSGYNAVNPDTKSAYTFDANSPVLGNENLRNLQPDGSVCKPGDTTGQMQIDWLWITMASWDLRNTIAQCVVCPTEQKLQGYDGEYCWKTLVSYTTCQATNNSPITNQSVCYTVEALRYAQSSYFVGVVAIQWSNIFACKCRKSSLIYSKVNDVMIWGIVSETLICFFLMWTPGVQLVFGGRPLLFNQFFTNALPFSMCLLIWEETRKFLIRNFPSEKIASANWFEKHSLW